MLAALGDLTEFVLLLKFSDSFKGTYVLSWKDAK